MPALKGTTVRRGGVTSHYWYETINGVAIDAASSLRISFSMSSKGGGYTQVQMEIRPDDFPLILEMMAIVNRQAALEAMSGELNRQIITQPARDQKRADESAKHAIESISHAAHQKWNAAPYGEDENERIVRNGVDAIIEGLKAEKETSGAPSLVRRV